MLHGSRRWRDQALGDFCHETTTVILPGFLAVMGVPAVFLGFIEGVADAVSSFTKMAGGFHRR